MSNLSSVPARREGSEAPRRPRRESHSRGSGAGFVAKLVVMALVNAFGLYGVLAAWAVQHWGILAALAVGLVVVDLVYFLPSRKLVPAKYFAPGVAFLLVFQVFVVLYTAGIAFTNYGDGHNATKADAVAALVAQGESRIEGTPSYAVTVVEQDGTYGLAAVDADGQAYLGLDGEVLQPAPEVTVSGGRATEVSGADVLDFPAVVAAQDAVLQIRVAVSADEADGLLRTNDGRTAMVYEQNLVHDAEADTLTSADGTVYRPVESGNFASADGEVLNPGWRVFVGVDNFAAVFDRDLLGAPFVTVTVWTFAFAVLSVGTTFFLGLGIAILFNNATMTGRRFYRAVVILPYAFPGFLSILIWAGLLNRDFGFINETLLGGAAIPWLSDPWLARLSAVGVNLWLGFPYMFLITTGALQAVPAELYESARMDGAGPFAAFRRITLPLLLVAVGPLLIASFAMNFNNFNLIYLLTGGGPRDLTSPTGVGATDILITFVYKIAFESGQNQYGLASAISILIFVMVAVVSAIAFRRSKALEEIS